MTEGEFDAWTRSPDSTPAEWADGATFDLCHADDLHHELMLWLLTVVRLYVNSRRLGLACSGNLMRLADQRCQRMPDLYFVAEARRPILGYDRIEGPADLAVEVVSAGYADHDYVTKFHEYEAAGVREYWVADPQTRTFAPFALGGDGRYAKIDADADGRVRSVAIPGLWLRPADLFADDRPSELAVLAELGVA